MTISVAFKVRAVEGFAVYSIGKREYFLNDIPWKYLRFSFTYTYITWGIRFIVNRTED